MLKKFIFFGVSCLLSLSLSLPVFAQSVPEDIESAITQDLKKSEKQISKLINMDKNTKSIQSDSMNPSIEGSYPVYFLSVNSDTYTPDLNNYLNFDGYLFEVADESGSNLGLAFTDESVNYSEIVQMSTDTDFSSQIATAKTLVGYTENSKLIYDLAYRVVALVTPQEDAVKVVMLRDSNLNSLNQYEVYDFEDFINKIKTAQAKRMQEASRLDTNEPVSGGGTGITSDDPSSGNTLIFLISTFAVIVAGTVSFIFIRSRKKHS
jgi:hypothetical protein